LEKPYYKGDTMHKLECATKCSLFHKYILKSLAKTASSSFPNLVQYGRHGSAASRERHCCNLSDRWEEGIFIPPSLFPNGSLGPSDFQNGAQSSQLGSLSFSIVALKLSSIPL
jgi:hypothetical protein